MVDCDLLTFICPADKVGRRKPLLYGCIALSLCLFYLGGYLTAVGPRTEGQGRSAGDYTAIVAIFLYASGYCLGWNSCPLTVISEIFTMRFRVLSMTLCLMWQWLCTFSIVRIMPIALSTIYSRTYFIFAAIFGSGTFFIYFLIPETKGLPLEYMDQLFGVAERTDVEKALEEGNNKPTNEFVEDVIGEDGTTKLPTVRE
jgi:MFS family permease